MQLLQQLKVNESDYINKETYGYKWSKEKESK